MTIANFPGLQLDGADDRPGQPERSTALFFALESSYLTPFKVLLASMIEQRSMLHAPVILCTTDLSVMDDPVTRAVVDRVVHLDAAFLQKLEFHVQDAKLRSGRLEWHVGTLLKWAAFDDYGVDQILFLDADMLCLAPFEPLIDLEPEADLVGVSQMVQATMRGAFADSRDRYLELMDLELAGGLDLRQRGLNSGVMVIRKRLLNREFQDALFAFRPQEKVLNEQMLITRWFRSNPEYRLAFVSNRWNFHEQFLDRLHRADRDRYLAEVAILHYAGPGKPWKRGRGLCKRRSLALWWKTFDRLPVEAAVSVPES